MAPPRDAWAAAFAEQARSDWSVYRLLALEPEVARCHALHYLQMACEKIAKAYRARDTAAELPDLLGRHVGFAKFVSSFLLSPAVRQEFSGKEAQLSQLRAAFRHLARGIEKLAPAVDRQDAPENAEYPWARGDEVIAPCRYDYPSLSLLREPGGRTFLRLVERALGDFETLRLSR
ncbi:MAG: hypothetical protein HY744_27480 [Deltaproteobacteria bacterium]|nr:hypothetical protein [Deltaproteobacteria bacterium]